MLSFRLTTWNVLHRVHAVNWQEGAVQAFPDERARIAGISQRVARWLADGVAVVCLQEVSGDQLASLRRAVGEGDVEGVRIFQHLYPRVPALRGGGPPLLEDATEHLVMIVKGLAARLRDARTFDTDSGKGLLAVDVDVAGDGATVAVSVIDTHVTFGERGAAQLELLATMARASAGGAIILGDFNAPADAVQAALGAPVVVSNLEGQRPTRTATLEHSGKTIDHIAVHRATVESATVLDGEGLSDHHPVTATVVVG